MVEPVKPDRWMIYVVSQTDDESITLRDRRDLHQRDAFTDNQVAQERDMPLQSRDTRVGGWLALGKKKPYLPE